MAQPPVKHVVADAGAFLKNAALQNIGQNIYTLRDVVNEIRDKTTRRRLAILPYQLIFKEPHPEHVRLVSEFSKKTGDYPSLSATDIKVLALTYQLELENVGSAHLKSQPHIQVNVSSTLRHPETPVNVAGFHFPSKNVGRSPGPQSPVPGPQSSPQSSDGSEFNSFQFWRTPPAPLEDELLRVLAQLDVSKSHEQHQTPSPTVSEEFNSFQFWREPLELLDDDLLQQLMGGDVSVPDEESEEPAGHGEDQSDDEDKENEPDEEGGDDDDDGGGGWITPGNIQRVQMDTADWTAPADVTVGCLTTDFAMQNVLIQMGLRVLSVDGLRIRQARHHVLRCHACFRTTSNMDKVFCPHCGNKTLKKVAVTVRDDGTLDMHFSANPRVMNSRGLRHPLPLPRGGKHSSNPQLVEDQRAPQQRLSRRARQKTDVFHPDYTAATSPFCPHDLYSRSAGLHLRDDQTGSGRRRTNPNASRRFVKRK